MSRRRARRRAARSSTDGDTSRPARASSPKTTHDVDQPGRRNASGPVTSGRRARRIISPSYRLRTMSASVKTSVTELPESRVRVEAEVSPEEVDRRVQQAARELGRQMKIPGFRKGKVPPPVVIRRLGRDAVLDEALRSSLHNWYADAIDEAGITPIGEPDLDVGDLPAQGKPLSFSIEIGVRPRAALGELQGPRGRPRASRSSPTRRSTPSSSGMRERFATLETVERRSGPRRPRRDGLLGLDRRRAVRRRRGARPVARARLGAPDPRLRGAAHRRRGRRGADRRGRRFPTTTPSSWPARPRPSR